jgi:hypothetical protein
MMGRAVGADPNDKDGSLLSGIKDMFMSVAFKGDGAPGMVDINSQTRKMLDKGQQETIKRNFYLIDNMMKKECLFCGSILIDMIDNDIETEKASEFATGESKRRRYGSKQESSSMLSLAEEDEWDIK